MVTTVRRRPAGPLCALAALLFPLTAHADYLVRSPDDIDQGVWELEHNGAAIIDGNPAKGGATSNTAEIGYGVTSWWYPELEFDFERGPGPDQPTNLQGFVWENTLRFTEPGEYWADLGFYWEYGHAIQNGIADETTFGPLVQKDIGRTTHILNLFFTKQIGSDQETHGWDTSYAWQSRWNIYRLASPAVEVYGDAGQFNPLVKFPNQQLLAGPVVLGEALLGPYGKLKYEAGYLFGATGPSPVGAVRWRMEWEMRF